MFPSPLDSVATGRPFYPDDLPLICLDVRYRNCGIDGRPVLSYCQRHANTTSTKRTIKPAKNNQHGESLDGLRALGLTTVTAEQIAATIKNTFQVLHILVPCDGMSWVHWPTSLLSAMNFSRWAEPSDRKPVSL